MPDNRDDNAPRREDGDDASERRDGDAGKPQGRGKKVRVDLRKNRGKLRRDKAEWTRRLRGGDVSAEDLALRESVRRKGDLSRKRTIIVHDEPQVGPDDHVGVVTAVRGLFVEVEADGRLWACTVRRLLRTRLIEARSPITVGDRVRIRPVAVGEVLGVQVSGETLLPEGIVEEVSPRATTLLRHYERRAHLIAANVDQCVIVVAADEPPLRPHLIDRYLVAIHHGHMRPIICINKADLDADGHAAEVVERYRGLSYCALLTSTVDGRGIDALREVIAGQTSAFVGPSGVGKSSLLNAIEPGFDLRVGTLTDLRRGKHTTTTARLLKWSFGGYVVDTPGVRQFDPASVGKEELEAYFIEFRDLVSQCKFPDCSHRHEGQCAVRTAVDDGRITLERYESYCKMYEECAERKGY